MKYTVIRAPIQLPAGTRVKLSEDQARRRGAQLEPVKGRQYECLVSVWFKAGETIDIDEVPKHVLAFLEADTPRRTTPQEKTFVPPTADETNAPPPATAPAMGSPMAGDEAAPGSPLTDPAP